MFASGGGEAIDLAMKSARRATGRRRVISVRVATTGTPAWPWPPGTRCSRGVPVPGADDEFPQVPFNDLSALDAALAAAPTAAVILETIPATPGFPCQTTATSPGVRTLCDRLGALYIADEVQTGLGRTVRSGRCSARRHPGHPRDRQGPIRRPLPDRRDPALGARRRVAGRRWLVNVSTFGGAELGCRVARAVLDITARPETTTRVEVLTTAFANGLAGIAARHPAWLVEVRQTGLVIGLRFAHPMGGLLMTRACYDAGLWALFANFDRSVLQFKPGLLMSDAEAGEADSARGRDRRAPRHRHPRRPGPCRSDVRPGGHIPQRPRGGGGREFPMTAATPTDGARAGGRRRPSRRHHAVTAHPPRPRPPPHRPE